MSFDGWLNMLFYYIFSIVVVFAFLYYGFFVIFFSMVVTFHSCYCYIVVNAAAAILLLLHLLTRSISFCSHAYIPYTYSVCAVVSIIECVCLYFQWNSACFHSYARCLNHMNLFGQWKHDSAGIPDRNLVSVTKFLEICMNL